jgi:isopentenyl-diphosphate Delta-isomerase
MNKAEPEDEIFEIYDKISKEKIGKERRGIVHKKGYLHKSVNIILMNDKNEILLQKRNKNKKIFPLRLDLSCAEHLQENESYKEGAIRGLKEELGINIKEESLELINEEEEVLNVFEEGK